VVLIEAESTDLVLKVERAGDLRFVVLDAKYRTSRDNFWTRWGQLTLPGLAFGSDRVVPRAHYSSFHRRAARPGSKIQSSKRSIASESTSSPRALILRFPSGYGSSRD